MIRVLDRITDGLLLALFTVLFLIGMYTVLDNLYVYSGASFHGTNVYKPADPLSGYQLRELSPDVIGWITLDETGVDYPVMQGKTNSQYLNTDPYGEYSTGGSIFLDVRNASDFSDAYNMIYGHHMEAGAMFGALDAYQERSFFDTHESGQIITTGNRILELSVFACGTCNAKDREVFDLESEMENARRLSWIRNHADFFREPETLHWIALTTCRETSGMDRTFVICSVMEKDDRTSISEQKERDKKESEDIYEKKRTFNNDAAFCIPAGDSGSRKRCGRKVQNLF